MHPKDVLVTIDDGAVTYSVTLASYTEAESIQIDEKKKKKNDDDEEEFEEDSEMFDTVSDLNDYLNKINSKSF